MKLYVVRHKPSKGYCLRSREGLGTFEESQFYHAKAPATSRRNWQNENKEDFEVLEINVEEPQ